MLFEKRGKTMWLIILLVIVVVVITIVKNGSGNNTASSNDVATLFSYYKTIRNDYHSGSRSSSVIIGSPIVEYNGTSVLSGFLAVYVSEDDNSGAARAQALGMQTKARDGKFEHQFVIRKKFSKQTKRQLLQAVGVKIQEAYPNDLLKYDDTLPLLVSVVDLKDFIEMLQNRN